MRPKILIFISILTVGVMALLLNLPRPEKSILGTESESKEALNIPVNKVTIELDGKKYSASWGFVENADKLELLPNFTQKSTAEDTLSFEKCKLLTSAGFYTKDDKPTGLFISDGKILRKFSTNSLTNGVLSVNYFGIPRITTSTPEDPLRIAIQVGPVLIDNTELRTLSLVNDSEDRRMVAAVTGENKLLFITFYDPESAYLGPKLVDLPRALSEFEEKSKIQIADAVNLDGGSASAFYTPNFKFSEIQNVGAFFCER